MVNRNLARALKALAREGLEVEREGLVHRVRLAADAAAPTAEVLLPEEFPLEGKALQQLARFVATRHPEGGAVARACATPDFHPGETVPVGAVVATTADMVIPQAIGTDINCGMRLHVADIGIDRFLSRKAELVEKLKGDLLLGTRDLPMPTRAMRALFRTGCLGWVEALRNGNGGAARPGGLGQLERADFRQLERELERVYHLGSETGDEAWVPDDLLPEDRESIRDGNLATVGGGNHFVEIQVVDEVVGRGRAWEWGVRAGQVTFMIHTGSRAVGQHVGGRWKEKAKELWPEGRKHPESGIFPVRGEAVGTYLAAMNTATNYAYLNRLLIAELVRLRMREVFGSDLEVPLVFDVPHNVILDEGGLHVHRKGATPAHPGQPVLIPGSMGHPSWLLEGLGEERFLSSASHGAGRAATRFEMGRQPRTEESLGLRGVECITLNEDRRIEEAPAAYKPIGPVVEIQVEAGIVRPVARMKPLLTFKA